MSERSEYEQLAERLGPAAGAAAPLLAGFNACVDEVHRLTPDTLDVVTDPVGDAPPLARRLYDRIVAGRGGEVFEPSGYAQRWLADRLGKPDLVQVGGTGAQAAWTLAELGAPSVLALADRSPAQLAVLHPGVGLCTGGAITPAGRLMEGGGRPAKPPHSILEFASDTRWRGGIVARSSRIIVRFAEDGIERDPDFAAAAPRLAATAGAGLVSGLNGVPDHDTESRAWLRRVVASWRDAGLSTIHLELAEYPRPADLTELLTEYEGLVSSVGMSLSELGTLFARKLADPALAALELAQRHRLARVFVHADRWALVVHRTDPVRAATAVRLGNLLAAARAAHGSPTGSPHPPPAAQFTVDHPATGWLGGGWRVACAPAPHLPHPASTVGLGDTFVAGALLADCLTNTWEVS